MATVFTVAKRSLLQDLQEFIAYETGKTVDILMNYPVLKSIDVTDEDGNVIGQRDVFDKWRYVEEQVAEKAGGLLNLATRNHATHGWLHFAMVVSSGANLSQFAQDNPAGWLLVGNINNLDGTMRTADRNKLNSILPQSRQVPANATIKQVIRGLGRYYGNDNFNRLRYAMRDPDNEIEELVA